jgi:predicted dehydrogenase
VEITIMIRCAVVGFGGFGWTLVRAVEQTAQERDCQLVAAADARLGDLPERAEELKARGVELYDDAVSMLDALSGRCDAVYLATSIGSHEPLTCAAAGRGYHIHLEKPPAGTIQEVASMIRAVDDAGVCCLVGFQQVHRPDVLGLKKWIASGRLGKISTVTCRAGWPRTKSYYDRNEWAGKLRSGDRWVLDGPAMNALAHQVNNLLFFASPSKRGYATPVSVRAELYACGGLESHNTAAIEIDTDTGVRVYFLTSHATDELFGPVFEVHGEKGTATLSMDAGARLTLADGSEEAIPRGEKYSDVVGNFLDAIEAGDPSRLRCRLQDAAGMTLSLNAAHESSERIHRIDESLVRRVGDDERMIVDGMDDLLTRAATQCCLFSDLSNAPSWVVRTESFDVGGYEYFPQRFTPDR